MWSVGVLAGALLGSLAARENVDPRVQFSVMAAVIAIGGVAATSWFAGSRPLAVFMRWVLHASQAQAALATSVFAGSMAAGRLCGDAVVRRTGRALSVRACGVLGVAGCLLVALSPATWPAWPLSATAPG